MKKKTEKTSKIPASKYHLPPTKKPRYEYYNNAKEAVERYNELLIDPKMHSLYLDPIKDAKGYWVIEVVEYTESYLKKYGK